MLLVLPGVVCGLIGADPESAFSQAAMLPLPARKASAPTGTQFYNLVTSATEAVREQMILEQIAEGNVPDFLRTLKPVTATYSGHNATYHVTADYMAIGSDADFFRMPMSGPLAQQVADICGATLTTRKICNDVYTQASVKLAPFPFSPANWDIDSVPVFWLSNQAIENQRAQASAPLGALIAGIKKDVVVTPEFSTRPPVIC